MPRGQFPLKEVHASKAIPSVISTKTPRSVNLVRSASIVVFDVDKNTADAHSNPGRTFFRRYLSFVLETSRSSPYRPRRNGRFNQKPCGNNRLVEFTF